MEDSENNRYRIGGPITSGTTSEELKAIREVSKLLQAQKDEEVVKIIAEAPNKQSVVRGVRAVKPEYALKGNYQIQTDN